MYSFKVPQMILAAYLVIVIVGAPILRKIMIKRGATGFVSWRDFWSTWSADVVGKIVLVAILFWGGFWG